MKYDLHMNAYEIKTSEMEEKKKAKVKVNIRLKLLLDFLTEIANRSKLNNSKRDDLPMI